MLDTVVKTFFNICLKSVGKYKRLKMSYDPDSEMVGVIA